MSLLINSEIENAIDFNAKNVLNSVTVLTGFCKERAFNNLAKSVSANVKIKKIMVRLLLSDIVSGASDLNVYVQAKKYGWDMYIKFDLHSKMYVFDDKTCILGSANLTSKGMNLSKHGNLETAIASDLDCNDIHKIESLFVNSIKMTDEIYYRMKSQIENTEVEEKVKANIWDEDIIELFKINISKIHVNEFPSNIIDENAYKNLNSIEKNKVKLNFINSKPYLWLKNVFRENEVNEIYFGQLSENLHNILISDSRIYRSKVKEYLNILLDWTSFLCKDEFIIDVPNYSTRVRLLT